MGSRDSCVKAELKGENSQKVTYDMRKGKELELRYETTVDEETSTYFTIETNEDSSYDDEEDSSLECLGITFTQEDPSEVKVLHIKAN